MISQTTSTIRRRDITYNHNQTIVRRPLPGLTPNHNQTIVRQPIPGLSPNHNQTIARPVRRFALALALVLLGGTAAWAEPGCRPVHGTFTLAAAEGPCDSVIGLCATGEWLGVLNGSSEFIGTSAAPNIDTAVTAVITVTGDNVIHLRDGDVYTKDAIAFTTVGKGEFAEVDTIVGGTGAYVGATGRLQATGTFANGSGEGVYDGEICWP